MRCLTYYTNDAFKRQVVTYYSSWKALQWVSQEYCAAASGVRVQIQNDFKQNPNTEESPRIAVGLGAKLLASIDIQVIQNAEETKALEQALQN